uniref:Uncharacterized protein n=1 Tax=Haematobia irritans TaxID=7368 RepID=A0A1L8E8L1_HAEIR
MEVFVHFGCDIVDVLQDFLNNRLLAGRNSAVHIIQFNTSISVNFGSYTFAGTHVLGFEFLELAFPFLTIFLNFFGSFILGLLQSSCLAFSGFCNFFGSLLFCGQQLLDTLRLASHFIVFCAITLLHRSGNKKFQKNCTVHKTSR